jgi:hypothetical protein
MEEKQTAFAEFDNNILTRRRNLLPTWIKFSMDLFNWRHTAAIILMAGSLMTHISLSIYGIKANHPIQ